MARDPGSKDDGASTLSTARLAARAFDQMRGLLRREVDLVRAEADVTLQRVGAALAFFAVAFGLAIAGVNVLARLLVAVLVAQGLTPAMGALSVGMGLLAVGGVLALRGRAVLGKARFAPAPPAGRPAERDDFPEEETRHAP